MTIYIDENIPLLVEALTLGLPPNLTIQRFYGRTLTHEDLFSCVVLLVRSTTRVNAGLVGETPVCFVGTATSGSEHIDADFLHKAGIELHDARGCNANSVAEYVLMAIVLWAEKTQAEVRGKTIGILGYGHIGRRVAELTHSLGMKVFVSDLPFRASGGVFAPYCNEVDFRQLLEKSDILTNHVPLETEGDFATMKIFDQQALERMRAGTLFIHASRGGIVDEAALLNVMTNKKVCAAVDVWETEPLVNTDLARRCILATPHIAGYSYEGKIRGSEIMAKTLIRFFQDRMNTHIEVDWSVFENAYRTNVFPSVCIEGIPQTSLLAALRHSRCLEEDTAALLDILDKPNQEAGFDELRRTYPRRREIVQR